MKKLSYLVLLILLIFLGSCKESTPGCTDPNANNFNISATVNDECCFSCYTEHGYSVGEYCGYNLDFILENEFTGLIQANLINGDIVPASTGLGTEIIDGEGESLFWPYASFNITCY